MGIEAGAEFPSVEAADGPEGAGYLVIIERGESGWGAYVPDLPGVVAAADDEEEVRILIAGAVAFHLEGLQEEGEVVPAPTSRAVRIAR